MPANKLAIRRLTLYKHGVGFVERAGELDEDEVQLVFRQAEVNDALKSLLVIERQGGQVRGIHYETPRSNYPMENKITLSPDNSLLDLLRSLRGQTVQLTFGDGTSAIQHTGQLLGVEVDPQKPLNRSLVALLEQSATNDTVISLPLENLRSVHLLEERVGEDLRYFLDSSRNDEAHRTVTLQLDSAQEKHDLTVSYLVPSPTWRVSYRLVAETEKATPEKATPDQDDRRGQLLLQGWGLFDNRLEEDLEEVNVRLVAGQPISFIYDLATSRIPQRPTVQDAARIAAGPVEFEAALAPMATAAPSYESWDDMQAMSLNEEEATGGMQPFSVGRTRAAKAMPAPARPAIANMQGQPSGSTGVALGELFQYNVTAPVTVKRGESALVPILNNTLPYKHELLYNGQKMAQHPVATLRFKNETGLVLERGPVTILEDGEYRGEAMIPFSSSDMEVYLAYAVELGIKVTETQANSTLHTRWIRLEHGLLHFNQYYIISMTYKIENKLTEQRVVTIEKPIMAGWQLSDTQPPNEQTADFYRWKVACQAQRLTEFRVTQIQEQSSMQQINNQDYARLAEYLRQNWLDRATYDRIKPVLDEQQKINQCHHENNLLHNERNEIYNRQQQLRQNLAALATTGEEAVLRRQVFERFSNSEHRLTEIEKRAEEIKAAIAKYEQNIQAMLASFK